MVELQALEVSGEGKRLKHGTLHLIGGWENICQGVLVYCTTGIDVGRLGMQNLNRIVGAALVLKIT